MTTRQIKRLPVVGHDSEFKGMVSLGHTEAKFFKVSGYPCVSRAEAWRMHKWKTRWLIV